MSASPTTLTIPAEAASVRSPVEPRFTRRADWHARLLSAYEVTAGLPFAYGVHDCCLWAAHCVDAMCGTSLAREVTERFNYRDETTAGRIIEAGGGLLGLASMFLGHHASPLLAMPGDVVLVRDYENTPVIGVLFDHTAVVPTATGLLSLPMERAVCCWRI